MQSAPQSETLVRRFAAPSNRTIGTGVWYALLLVVPVAFVAYPMVVLFIGGFFDPATGGFTLGPMQQIFSNARYATALYNTIFIAFGTTFITMAISVPLAFYLWQQDFACKRLLLNLLVIPYMMPVYIIALLLILLFGQNGLISEVIANLLGDPDYRMPFKVMFNMYSLLGVYIFHSFALVLFLMLAFLSGIDPSVIEAARSLGAGPVTAIRRVVLPMAAPAVTGAAMLVFARTMVDYVVIDTIGGYRFRTLSVEVYNLTFGFMEQELAAPMAVLLSVMTFIIMYSYLYLFRWRRAG